jgi:hypothetical protein
MAVSMDCVEGCDTRLQSDTSKETAVA